MTNEQVIQQFQDYVISNYTRYPVCLERGEESTVWDIDGNRYLDFFPGWGCGLIGHCPPKVVEAVQKQIAELIHVPNTWYMKLQGQLAEALSKRTNFNGRCFFCNSGTEANEAAIKLARLWGKSQSTTSSSSSNSTNSNRYKIITMLNSFHGRTMGALSATGQPKYHRGVEPLLPGFQYAPFGDAEAIEKLIDKETVAVMLEPIQGEGGINLPPQGYIEIVREICDRHHLLMICDEVQTGMGRTGKWYSHQHWSVQPDIVTLAKALAGGVAAGGLIAKPEIAEKLKPGTHAATFGGNPIACSAALATIETIEEEGLLKRATEIGEHFHQRLLKMKEKSPIIQEIRILGAMIGVQLIADGAPIVQEAMKHGLLINCTHQTVLRLLPSLRIKSSDIDQGCDILEKILPKYQ